MQAIISVFEFPPKESLRILDEKKDYTNLTKVIFYTNFCSGMLKYLMNLLKMYLVILESLYGM